jgi:hypothetical protein
MGIDIIIHIADCIIFQKPTEKADALPAEGLLHAQQCNKRYKKTGKPLFLSR